MSALQDIPMLDLSREFAHIRDEVMAAMEAVCSRQQFVLGPAAASFEARAAAFCHAGFALGCASGTDALWLALVALGIGPGDSVITSPFSFYATASAILRSGATPVFADIDPQTFNLSPEAAAEVLATPQPTGTRLGAILPVHLFGQCADMDAFTSLAQGHDLKLIEDAAQAFGARWAERSAGSLGDTAAFSFYPTKNLSAFGDAGMVTTSNSSAADRIRALRNHGMRQRYLHDDLGSGDGTPGPIGWNSRLDGIQAAVLEIKLRRLPAANQRRRDHAALYNETFRAAGLAGTSVEDGVVLPYTDPCAEPIFHQYVIRAPRRDDLRAHLTAKGIGTEIYYPLPLHLQASLKFLGYGPGDFPESERAAGEVLALPMYPELREDEVATIVGAASDFYSKG